ncbi:MAG TPA: LPS assembly protein LptD [Candidatus Binataceae bacterium]|nr:LPS assembly protein LptD [Candidatus Binataceae bacterium]
MPATVLAQSSPLSSMIHREHQGPLTVTGQNFEYDYKTNTFVVTGNAVVRQQTSILTADQIDLARGKRELHAKGHVHLIDPLTEIKAREGRLNLNNETGDLTDATISNYDKTVRIQGAQIHKMEGQRYSVLDGVFTTCGAEPGTPDWSISANQMDIHMGQSATAHGAYFNILGYPVLYSPYAAFPADTSRHSGLLTPRLGESGLRGFQLLQPYYWAIDRSSDATFALDIETSQRVGGLAEYRLLTGPDNYFVVDGAFYNESLRSEENRQNDIIDTQIANPYIPSDRYDLIGMARQHITDDLVAYGDAMTVSDPLLLREVNVWTLSRTAASGIFFPRQFQLTRNAVSDFGLLDSYQNGYVQFGGIFNQDLIQPQPFALQTLPELLVSGRKDLFGGLLYTDYDFTGDNFYRSAGQQGLRLDLDPRVTLPWRLGDYVYGFGTLGLRETMYDTSGHDIIVTPVGQGGRLYNNGLSVGPLAPGGFQSRELIWGTTGIASELERVYKLNWEPVEKLKHTIEPFVTYTYVPNMDQSSLPLFDETDRVEGRSLLVYGATSRIFLKFAHHNAAQGTNPETPIAMQDEGASHPFMARSYVNGSTIEEVLRVTLEQAYDTTHAVAKGSSRFSDLDLIASAFPARTLSIGGQLTYSPQVSTVHYASLFTMFQPWWTSKSKINTGSYLMFGYTYIGPGPTFEPGVNSTRSQYMSLTAYYELFRRVAVLFSPAYDFTTHQLLSAEYGLRLKPPCNCWMFDMGITNTVNPAETQFQFQVTLGGLGSIGKSPFMRMPLRSHMGVLPAYY